jgi:nicotinamide riboside kinase
VPWVAEGRMREQPERRAELFERFRAALAAARAKVVDIEGSWDERRRRAVEAIGVLLGDRSHPAG